MVKVSGLKHRVTADMETQHEACEDHWYAGYAKLEEPVRYKHGDAGEVAVAASQSLSNPELAKGPWNENHCRKVELESLLLIHSH